MLVHGGTGTVAIVPRKVGSAVAVIFDRQAGPTTCFTTRCINVLLPARARATASVKRIGRSFILEFLEDLEGDGRGTRAQH
jgi:hypothetical protein